MLVLPQNVQSEHGALQGSWPGVSRRREDGGEVGGVSGRAKGGGGPEVERQELGCWGGRCWSRGSPWRPGEPARTL